MSGTEAPDAFDGATLDLVVPSTLDGMRIDRVLSMLTGRSRADAHDVLTSGAVQVNDVVVSKPSTSLAAGQHLVALLPPAPSEQVAPEAAVPVDVALDDDDFVVINKAPGQVVHPGAGHARGTLIAGVLARYPEIRALSDAGLCDPARPGVVHRLDKGTSGLLVVAKTADGFASLSAQLARREMQRTYLALVQGHVNEERGVVDAPIGRSTRTPSMMAVRSDGREARTNYEVLARLDAPSATTLLRLNLETGRTHQIRVHLATIGHPVVNDLRYGHRRDPRLEDERFFLHSSTLGFTHPRRDEWIHTRLSLPADLAPLVPGGEEY
jgi:23S rRNA pseudouridine1911/1915/1917 synthase